jgi:AraC family transcriptional regulator
MHVRVETLSARLCVCLRHHGPYATLPAAFRRLFAWARAEHRLSLGLPTIGLSYNDAADAPPEQHRYDICLPISAPAPNLPDGFSTQSVGAGLWAIHTLAGPYNGMPAAFAHLFTHWLPTSGHRRDPDRPCMEIYLNDVTDVPPADLRTELCIPLLQH